MEIVAICVVFLIFLVLHYGGEKERRRALADLEAEKLKRITLESKAARLSEENYALNTEVEHHLDRLNELVSERDRLRGKPGGNSPSGGNSGPG